MGTAALELRRRALAPFTDKAGTFAPLKAAVFVLLVLPGLWIAYRYYTGTIGGNALKAVVRETGLWGIRFLVLTLAVTPLRRTLVWPKLVTTRRMIGVAAFVYSALHLLAYFADMAFEWTAIGSEIVLSFYLLVGTIGLLAMVPLTITSTDAMVRRLGGHQWRRLHQAVYAVGVLAMLHFYLLLSKLHTDEAQILAGLLLWLLLYRVLYWWRDRASTVWLAALSLVVWALTILSEAVYFLATTGGRIPIDRVVLANFTLEGGLRPAWVVLGAGLVLTAAGWYRDRTERAGRRARRGVEAG